uniref:Protein vip1 n=2 Tax=Cajanus cajan TaxID=3821 RepID=A0A151TLT7_CAJCA|nr:hypothetical protein KK1_021622 [Cajanus cajan]
MQSDTGGSQVAHVTFSTPDGAETAVLLSGAVVCGQSLTIDLAPEYALPGSTASETQTSNDENPESGSGLRKAEDVVTSMLAKGFILGKGALDRAKTFDEKHQLSSKATAKVVSLDQKVGLSEKISAGTVLVNGKVKEMDEKYQVSEKTKSAISVAEQSVSSAGSAIMKNRYVLTGATWVTGAYNRVAKAAEEVGQKTKEKVLAQDNQGKTEEGNVQNPTSETTTPNEPSKPGPHQATTGDHPSNPVTTQALTTGDHPSNPVTTQALTTGDHPSNPVTTQALTTGDHPSNPVTAQALTKGDVPSNPTTTHGMTTGDHPSNPATTQALTTGDHPSNPATTQSLTTGDHPSNPATTQGLTL